MAAELVKCEHCGRTNRVPAAASGTPRCGNCHQPLPWIADAGDGTFAEVAQAATASTTLPTSACPGQSLFAPLLPLLPILLAADPDPRFLHPDLAPLPIRPMH